MRLVRLTKTVRSKGLLLDETKVKSYIKSDEAYFQSIYYYGQDALDYYKANKNSIKDYRGDVSTPNLIFDIDSDNLEISRENTIKLIDYLKAEGLYDDFSARLSFSGSKGFHIIVTTGYEFKPKELKAVCMHIAKQVKFTKTDGFKIDPKVYNTNRIFRVTNTKHEKSGLYKIDMLEEQIRNYTMDQIKDYANKTQPEYKPEKFIPGSRVMPIINKLNLLKEDKEPVEYEKPNVTAPTIAQNKPCMLRIASGDIPPGESNTLLLRLANEYRSQGLSRDECFDKLIKVGENRETKYPNANAITEEKLKFEILSCIYGGEGYNFFCSDESLREYCPGTCPFDSRTKIKTYQKQIKTKPRSEVTSDRGSFRPGVTKKEIKEPIKSKPVASTAPNFRSESVKRSLEDHMKLGGFKTIAETSKSFKEFTKDVKKSRVETGIKDFDDSMRILPNGLTIINAKPGVGKTSSALNMMINGSKKGQTILFYSIDMAEDEFFTKIKSKVLGITPDEVLDLYYSDDPESMALQEEGDRLTEECMKNVHLCYESMLTTDKIESDLNAFKQEGIKVNVVIIDYLQKIQGASDYSKSTDMLLKLKSFISKFKIPIIGLSQIPRTGGGNEETPIHTAAAAQGGAIYEANASICVNFWRPLKFAGTELDKVMGYSISKNRMGECKHGLLYFNGAVSELRSLTDEERENAELDIMAYEETKKVEKKGKFR